MNSNPAPCSCKAPGWCPRYRREMIGRLWELCSGKCTDYRPCTESQSIAYRKIWDAKVAGLPRPEVGTIERPQQGLIGLGDAVAAVTSFFGIKPCGGCKKRQQTLNRWLPFKRKRVLTGITATYRRVNNLPVTIESVQRAGFDSPIVFAEPRTETDYRHTYYNWEFMGSYWNFLVALHGLYSIADGASHILIVQDDVLLSAGLWNYIKRTLPGRGIVSLYTCSVKNASLGWTKTEGGWGALAYLIDVDTVKQIVDCTPIMAQRGRFQTDVWIAEWCKEHKVDYWQHTPSFALHLGVQSSIGGKRGQTASRQCSHWIRSIDPWEVVTIDYRADPTIYSTERND